MLPHDAIRARWYWDGPDIKSVADLKTRLDLAGHLQWSGTTPSS